MKRIISVILVCMLCIGATAVFADIDAENVTVIAEDKVLKKDVDYTLTYRDNTNPGTATVVVNFIGNYVGTMERTFEIKKAKRTNSGSSGRSGNRIVITPTAEYAPPYITGYADGTFRPETEITRAEAATAVARAIGLEPQSNGNTAFDDVIKHWACGYINAAADKEIANGYEDGSFRPDENITRAEFTKIIAKLTEKEIQEKSAGFSDTKGHWAEPYIVTLAEKGIINGYQDNTFRPDKPITRAEAVAIINRAVTRNCAPDLTMKFTDITPEHWAYEDILKAANPHNVVTNPNAKTLVK